MASPPQPQRPQQHGVFRRALGAPIIFSIIYTSVASAIYFSLGVVADHALGLTPVVFLVAGLFFVLDGDDLRRGRVAAPGARRRDGVRALRVQRAVELHRGLGDPPRLPHPHRGHRVLGDELPRGVLGRARRRARSSWSIAFAIIVYVAVRNILRLRGDARAKRDRRAGDRGPGAAAAHRRRRAHRGVFEHRRAHGVDRPRHGADVGGLHLRADGRRRWRSPAWSRRRGWRARSPWVAAGSSGWSSQRGGLRRHRHLRRHRARRDLRAAGRATARRSSGRATSSRPGRRGRRGVRQPTGSRDGLQVRRRRAGDGDARSPRRTPRCSGSRAWRTRWPRTGRSPARSGGCTGRARRRTWSSASPRCSPAALVVARGPRLPRRHLRVRRDARVHDRARLDLHAALPRARPRPRPYRMPLSIPIGGGDARRCPALLGAIVSACGVRQLLGILHEGARYVGLAGWRSGSCCTSSTGRARASRCSGASSCPRPRCAGGRREVEYGSILVPILGTPLDDDIVQTAGRLAAEEHADEAEGEGATIEALWVFEVPMSLPLDARLPDAQLEQARAALRRAKAVGEEYEGVEVATATVRARQAGDAIVEEARRRGVEVIVLGAPRSRRASAAARGSAAAAARWRTSSARSTKYVRQQGAVPRDPHGAGARGRAPAGGRRGQRHLSARSLVSRRMMVLIVGAGRVGSAVAKLRAPRRSRRLHPGRGSALARAPRGRHGHLLGGRRRPLHRRHGARGRGAARRRASARPTSSSPPPTATTRTSSIAQIAQRRFNVPKVIVRVLDPARSDWYSQQGLHTICPTKSAIAELEDVLGAAS